MKRIIHILVGKRSKTAQELQKVLTEYGCIIKTRLGLHETHPEKCTEVGLVILELSGERKDALGLERKLKRIPDIKTKLVELSLD